MLNLYGELNRSNNKVQNYLLKKKEHLEIFMFSNTNEEKKFKPQQYQENKYFLNIININVQFDF